MKNGLIGGKLQHSLSPKLHNLLGQKDYSLFELKEDGVKDFVLKRDYGFINVTIPYKQTVMPFLDEIDEKAKKIGAVNTIINDCGKLIGYNTDYDGFSSLLKANKINLLDMNVLILGSGGTQKTVSAVCNDSGAKAVYICSRTGNVNYSNCYKINIDIIVNTTPVGMFPNVFDCPIDIKKFKNLKAVVDCVYNPLRTRLVLNALRESIKTTGGLAMLAFQGIRSESLYQKRELEAEVKQNALKQLYLSSKNIVLTGMSGCGKTQTAKLIAKKLGKEFYDTDKLVEKNVGKSVTEIFESYGEQFFRAKEKEAVNELSKKQGVVIATGGGVVLDIENMFNLKLNGKIYFIRRKLYQLARKNRPLAKDFCQLKNTYFKRLPIYTFTADKVVDNKSDLKTLADTIIGDFNENITY